MVRRQWVLHQLCRTHPGDRQMVAHRYELPMNQTLAQASDRFSRPVFDFLCRGNEQVQRRGDFRRDPSCRNQVQVVMPVAMLDAILDFHLDYILFLLSISTKQIAMHGCDLPLI